MDDEERKDNSDKSCQTENEKSKRHRGADQPGRHRQRPARTDQTERGEVDGDPPCHSGYTKLIFQTRVSLDKPASCLQLPAEAGSACSAETEADGILYVDSVNRQLVKTAKTRWEWGDKQRWIPRRMAPVPPQDPLSYGSSPILRIPCPMAPVPPQDPPSYGSSPSS
ncbi:hypothetical protein O3P69_002365 [Scylla paramamosain]|uniref:Uncharacterized protein n=1 Tax=Scylla paramamosain TaxID=85552 RepID=A0AAW0V6R9_SCYPA